MAHNWHFLYLLLCAPFNIHSESYEILIKESSSLFDFYVVPLLIAFAASVAFPYFDAGISWVQYYAVFWNKMASVSIAQDIDTAREKRLKKKIKTIKSIGDKEKVLSIIEKGGFEDDNRVFGNLNAICSELDIRTIQDSLQRKHRIDSAEYTKLEKLILHGGLIDNRFRNAEMRSTFEAFISTSKKFLDEVLAKMDYHPDKLIYDFGGTNIEKAEKFSAVAVALDFVLQDYLAFRNKVSSIFS